MTILKVIVQIALIVFSILLIVSGVIRLKKVIDLIFKKIEKQVQWLEERIDNCHKELDSLQYCSMDISRDLEDKRKVDIFLERSDLELLAYDLDYLINSYETDIEDFPEDIVKQEKLESKLRRTKVLYSRIKTFVESSR